MPELTPIYEIPIPFDTANQPQLRTALLAIDGAIAAIPAPLDSPNISIPGYTAADVGFTIRNENTTAGNLEGIAFANANADQVLIGAVNLGSSSTAGGRFFIATRKAGQATLVERLSVLDNGKVGLSTNSPIANLEIHKIQAGDIGGEVSLLISPIDTGSGDAAGWAIASASYDNAGSLRPDQTYTWGYNAEQKVGEPAWTWSIENYYAPGLEADAQMEHYMTAPNGIRVYSARYVLASETFDFQWNLDETRWFDAAGALEGPWMTFKKDVGIDLAFDTEFRYSGTRPWALTAGGVGLVAKLDASDLLGMENRYRLFQSGGNSGEVNFLDGDVAHSADHYLTFGSTGPGSAENEWTGFRHLGASAGQWQYKQNDGTWRLFNDGSALHQAYFGLNRTLGTAGGDWTEIGTIARTFTSGAFDVIVWDEYGTAQHYIVTTGVFASDSDWTQLLPLTGAVSAGVDATGVDFQNSTGKLRLRRLTNGGNASQPHFVIVKNYGRPTEGGPASVFTPTSTTGAGGTVARPFKGTPLTQYNGSVGINVAIPHASAIFQADSTTKGLLPPRLTTTERDAIGSPADGLTVFNVTTHRLNVYDSNGAAWEELGSGGGGGATVALDNLASVAINAALVLGTSDAFALGSATKMWSDLFLASGAVIDFNSDVTLTHSANNLTVAGGTLSVPDDAYDATTWNGNFDVPTKNALRDKIEAIVAGGGGIGGSTGATDNAALRADGTGGATAQASPLTIADTTGAIQFAGKSIVNGGTTDGHVSVTNAAGTGVSGVHLGPSTSEFTYLKYAAPFGPFLEIRTGDDSDYASLGATGIRLYSSGNRVFDINSHSANFGMASDRVVRWDSTGAISGVYDTGLARNSVGVVEVNNGTAGTFRDLKLRAIEMVDGNLVLGTATGTKIGTATGQKISLWNATPITQPTGIVDADGTLADITTKFNALVAKLESFGFLAVA